MDEIDYRFQLILMIGMMHGIILDLERIRRQDRQIIEIVEKATRDMQQQHEELN